MKVEKQPTSNKHCFVTVYVYHERVGKYYNKIHICTSEFMFQKKLIVKFNIKEF